jgi:TonB family protein
MNKLSVILAALSITITASSCTYSLQPSVRRDIEAHMRSKHDRFRTCYEQALSSDKDLEGRMTVKFTVEKNGDFDKVQVAESNLKNRELEECVISQTNTLKLDSADTQPVLVSYQLRFERKLVSVFPAQ